LEQGSESSDLLERAIERDPRYGLALARAAFCHSQIVFSGWAEDPEPSRHQSIELAQVDISPGLPVGVADDEAGMVERF